MLNTNSINIIAGDGVGRKPSSLTLELARDLVKLLSERGPLPTPEILRESRKQSRFNLNHVDYNKVYRVLMRLFNSGYVDRYVQDGKVYWRVRNKVYEKEAIRKLRNF